MSKIRKAVMAALTAATTAVVTELTVAIPSDAEGWAALAGKALAAAAVAGYATYRITNAPQAARG